MIIRFEEFQWSEGGANRDPNDAEVDWKGTKYDANVTNYSDSNFSMVIWRRGQYMYVRKQGCTWKYVN